MHAGIDAHRLTVFGDTIESRVLAGVLSFLWSPTELYDFSECIKYASEVLNGGKAGTEDKQTIILHNPHHSAGLIDILYELRFSLGWLGPLLIVTCPKGINEIESTDLFKVSGGSHGPVPQKCVPFPLLLGSLFSALNNLDGYGRFAWRRVMRYVRDKDLIFQAHELRDQLIDDMNERHDVRPVLEKLRDLLIERDGALLKFLPGHGHLTAINRVLTHQNYCLMLPEVYNDLQFFFDALAALPKIMEARNH